MMLQYLTYSSSSEKFNNFPSWAISSDELEAFSQARAMNASIMAAAVFALATASVSAVTPSSVDYAAVKSTSYFKSDEVKSLIFDQILGLTELPQHWDGREEDMAPSKSAAYDAVNFIEKIPPFIDPPEVMAAADGELGLFWASERLYLNVSFFGDGRMVYFGQMGDIEVKGSFLSSTSHGLPSNLAQFMSRIA